MSATAFRLDTSLLIILMLTIGVQAIYMPPWSWLILAAMLGWRAGAQWRGWRLPPFFLLMLLSALAALLVLFHYHSLWGRDAGVALLTLTAGLKLLETKQARDQLVLLLMGFFLSISLLLFDQGMGTALVVLLLFTGLITAWLTIETPGIPLGQRIKMAGQLLLLALPVALVLFLLFPRPPGGLWGVQQPVAGAARTGLSDTLSAGSFDALSKDPTAAFRVQFQGEIPPPSARYWRVLVMSEQINGIWHAQLPNLSAEPPRRVGKALDDTVRYTITLEPSDRRFVPTLMLPDRETLPKTLYLEANGSVFSRSPLIDRTKFSLESALDYQLDRTLSARERRQNLQLPPDNPQLKALGAQWQKLSPEAARDAALNYFHRQGFHYTLTPGRLNGDNRMDQFLFSTRRGYCEHYAEAFTLLMRAAGVPARLVTGYQGGEVIGDYLLVRQADAHAWSEIWLAHRGWVRVDPTSSVAPERIDTGLAQAAIDDTALPAVLRGGHSWNRQLSLTLDQIQNGWNQYVLGYSGSLQLDLLHQLGLTSLTRWQQVMLMMFVVAVLWWLMMRWWQKISKLAPKDAVDRAWQPLDSAFERLGLARQAGESFKQHIDRIQPQLPPELAQKLRVLSQQFSQWRYAAHYSAQRQKLSAQQARSLARALRFKKKKRKSDFNDWVD